MWKEPLNWILWLGNLLWQHVSVVGRILFARDGWDESRRRGETEPSPVGGAACIIYHHPIMMSRRIHVTLTGHYNILNLLDLFFLFFLHPCIKIGGKKRSKLWYIRKGEVHQQKTTPTELALNDWMTQATANQIVRPLAAPDGNRPSLPIGPIVQMSFSLFQMWKRLQRFSISTNPSEIPGVAPPAFVGFEWQPVVWWAHKVLQASPVKTLQAPFQQWRAETFPEGLNILWKVTFPL